MADSRRDAETQAQTSEVPPEKQAFEKPRMEFVAPKLVKYGEVNELTGFFGAFSP